MVLNHAKFFESIPDEPRPTSSSAVGQITCTVIIVSNEVKCLLLWEFRINNFSQRSLEMVFVGSIVNIKNKYLISRFMGNELECGTNKSPENRF